MHQGGAPEAGLGQTWPCLSKVPTLISGLLRFCFCCNAGAERQDDGLAFSSISAPAAEFTEHSFVDFASDVAQLSFFCFCSKKSAFKIENIMPRCVLSGL